MKRKKDDLDRLTEKLLEKDPSLKEEFKKADLALDIAGQVYDLRKKAGFTQKELAELVGTKQSNIARIESADYKSYSRKTLERIAKALNARLEVRVISTDSDYPAAVPHKIK